MSDSEKTWQPSRPALMKRVVRRPRHPEDTFGFQEDQVKPPLQPQEPAVPQPPPPPENTFWQGSWSEAPAGKQPPVGLQRQQAGSKRSRPADAEDGVLALAGGGRFSLSGHKVDDNEGLWNPRCGSALLAHLDSSEVMASLHCLNVRDQGPRQEDAKYLKPKPAEVVAVRVGTEREGADAEDRVGRRANHAHQSHRE